MEKDNVTNTGKNILKKINKEKVIYWGKYVLVLIVGILLGFFIKGKMLTATVPFKPRCHDSSGLIIIEFYISASKITLLFCHS